MLTYAPLFFGSEAAFVALAAALDAPWATLDGRLARAPGVGSAFLTAAAEASGP